MGATYTVKLSTLPAGTVTVTPTVPSGTDVRVSPASLEFGTTDWSTEQTVTVTAEEDDDGTSDPAVTITHPVSGYRSVRSGPAVLVTITEDDTPLVPDPDPNPDPDPEPEPEPEPFGVEIVGVPDVAVTGESYELTAQSGADSLVYEWRVDGGTITPDTAQTVVWTAPETASVAWIHVDVTREDGTKASQSTYVRVEVPEPAPEPDPGSALPLLGQLLLALGQFRQGVMRRVRLARRGGAGT